jgi:protein-tyrosine phosphatase
LKQKILFVCLGNICRSPLAKGLFNHMAEQAGLGGFLMADACGTAGHHQGEEPDQRTIRNARKNGLEIHHRARKLQPEDFQNFDFILTMDASNFRDTAALAGRHGFNEADIRMLRSFDPQAAHPEADVPDPWYGGEEGFEEVFQMLHRSCSALIAHLKKSNEINRAAT